jgi:aryl-alcohol dehydrogenase-like predicted oxidoreductase
MTMTSTEQTTFAIGGDIPVNRLGYGAMRLTGQPGNFGPYPEWEAGKALLRRAVELGVDHFDTARAYGPMWNERLIAEALWPYDGLLIATKGGIEKPAPDKILTDGQPDTLLRHIEESRQALMLDRIDLYYLHRPDPAVPFARQIEALKAAQDKGRIRHIGLSNVTLAQLQEAETIAQIAAVQNRLNLAEPADEALLDYTAQKRIAFVPWGPLGAAPLKQGAPLVRDRGSKAPLRGLLDLAPNILPIPGTTSVAHLEENARTVP